MIEADRDGAGGDWDTFSGGLPGADRRPGRGDATPEEKERSRMVQIRRSRKQRTEAAIAFALARRWEEAAAENRSLLDEFPDDIEAAKAAKVSANHGPGRYTAMAQTTGGAAGSRSATGRASGAGVSDTVSTG